MKPEEILELVRAGFTKEDIMGMVSTTPEQAQSPAADPQPAEDSIGGKESEEVSDNSAKEEKKNSGRRFRIRGIFSRNRI